MKEEMQIKKIVGFICAKDYDSNKFSSETDRATCRHIKQGHMRASCKLESSFVLSSVLQFLPIAVLNAIGGF